MNAGATPRGRRLDEIPVIEDGLDPIEVEKWRWFHGGIVWVRFLESLPTIFVPIFVILFFAVVFGATLIYEGNRELAIILVILASVAVTLLAYVAWRISRDNYDD